MYIAYELVILAQRNIRFTTLTIGYIQFRQGFEHVEEELTQPFHDGGRYQTGFYIITASVMKGLSA